MEEAITKAPLPTLLVCFGVLFLLFALGGTYGSFNISTLNRRFSFVAGVCLIFFGAGLWSIALDKETITSAPGKSSGNNPGVGGSSIDWRKLRLADNMGRNEINIDRYGDDLKGVTLSEAKESTCRDLCSKNSECKAFTYAKPNTRSESPAPACFLKFGPGSPKPDSCCISGLKVK